MLQKMWHCHSIMQSASNVSHVVELNINLTTSYNNSIIRGLSVTSAVY